MTTLAIIGSGILGRSLLYTLAKERTDFHKVILFHSDTHAPPCTLSSTAIVAPRGVTSGHSPLGDLMLEGYNFFSEHVRLDLPQGVEKIIQYTGATEKLENFKNRYPEGELAKGFMRNETYVAQEEAYLVDPKIYGDWLIKEAKMMEQYHLEVVDDFVKEVYEADKLHIKTQKGRHLLCNKIIFAGGQYNRYWKGLAPASPLETSKAVQGSYYEFNQVEWELPSFSLTLNGDNLIWNNGQKRLLIGSTTMEADHFLPDKSELLTIHKRLSEALVLKLPPPQFAMIKTGLREKARKRSPYVVKEGNLIFAGGLYKNGFSLSLKMARTLFHQYL